MVFCVVEKGRPCREVEYVPVYLLSYLFLSTLATAPRPYSASHEKVDLFAARPPPALILPPVLRTACVPLPVRIASTCRTPSPSLPTFHPSKDPVLFPLPARPARRRPRTRAPLH